MRFQVSMSDELCQRLDAQCKKLGASRNAYVVMKLAEAVALDEQKNAFLASMPDTMQKAMERFAKESAKAKK